MSIMSEVLTSQQNCVIPHIFHYSKPSHFSSEVSKLDSKNQIENLKKYPRNKKQNLPHQTMTVKNRKDIYVNFAMTKTQPEISRMQFPYFLEDDIPQKQTKKEYGLKIMNRVFTKRIENKNGYEVNLNRIENEEPPINQFLSYELSKQINSGLYCVKVLAEQIKKIKKQKQEVLQDRSKYKPKNKIRIAKSYKCGLLSKNMNSSTGNELEPN